MLREALKLFGKRGEIIRDDDESVCHKLPPLELDLIMRNRLCKALYLPTENNLCIAACTDHCQLERCNQGRRIKL